MSGKKAKLSHKISLVMIVKNEEKFLPGCLESVRNFVDEMVIVDTGSTDKTREIAQSFGAKVYDFEWQYDFSAARNFALSKATYPWILWLDADERLPEIYHQGLKKIIASGKYDALVVKLRSEVNGPLGKTPHYQQSPRIFRLLPGVRYEYPVHEQITPSLIRAGARFVMVDVILEHLGYAQDEKVIEEKIHRNLELLKKHLQLEPENAYAHYQMAQSLELLDRVEEAIEHYHLAIKYDDAKKSISPTVYLHLAAIHIKNNEYDQAVELAKKSFELTQNQFTAPHILAEIYYFRKEYKLAADYYQKVLDYLSVPITQRKLGIMIEKEVDLSKIYKKYLSALFLLQRYDEVVSELQKIINKRIPLSLQLSEVLSVVLTEQNVSASVWQRVAGLLNWEEEIEQEQVFYPFLTAEKWFDIPEFAENFYKKIQNMQVSPEFLFKAGEIFFNHGRLDYAYPCVKQASQQDEREPVWQLKGMCEVKLGLLQDAIATYETLHQKYPSNKSYLKLLGGLYAKTGNLDAAAAIVQQLMA